MSPEFISLERMWRLLWFLPVVLLTSCGNEPMRREQPPETPSLQVSALTLATQEWPSNYEVTGTVRARTTTTIASKVTGYVQKVSVQVGDHVRQGQDLITLDVRDLDVGVRHAEAARAVVESSIPELESATAAAKASLDLAQITFKRMEELASKRSISNQEMDEATARLKSAQANYEMTRARRAQLNSQMAQVEQEVRAAGITRDYARITAPYSGTVVTKTVEPGNLATPGAALLTVEQDGLYRLEASVDESQLAAMRVGQVAEVVIEADGKRNARISEIVPAIDAASRTGTVKLDLPQMPRLRTGMFGRAIFPMDSQKVVAVPLAALTEHGQIQSVFVVEDGFAHTRLITTGRRAKDSVEILSGVSQGDKVVTPVPPGLQDGARVEVRP